MSGASPPEPDRIEGAPHPRETLALIGQGAMERSFLDAFKAGRLHPGSLIGRPRGGGKATLAWRIARFLLATPDPGGQGGGLFDDARPAPDTLDVPADHPVARRIRAGADPGLYHITRTVNDKTGRLRDGIVAEDVRKLSNFLHLSATDGGRRVVILDAADDMTMQAANALLKMLEEPPARTTLLLVSHQPARLLPTIRSRCRDLRLTPLGAPDMAAALDQAGVAPGGDAQVLAELSAGSVGAAVRLINLDGLALYRTLITLLGALPQPDRASALKLAEAMAARGAEERFALLLDLADVVMSRLARTGATGQPPLVEAAPGEAETLARLSPTPARARAWAACAQQIGARLRHGRAVNLDPAALVLDMVGQLKDTAAG